MLALFLEVQEINKDTVWNWNSLLKVPEAIIVSIF